MSQDGHTTAGLETYTMPKYAPIPYVVQKARERSTKKITIAGLRSAKQGYAKPTRGDENTAGLSQVTKPGQAEPAQQKNGTILTFRPGYENGAR